MTTPEHLRDLADRNDAEAEAWRQFSKTSGRIALHEESATALRTAADQLEAVQARESGPRTPDGSSSDKVTLTAEGGPYDPLTDPANAAVIAALREVGRFAPPPLEEDRVVAMLRDKGLWKPEYDEPDDTGGDVPAPTGEEIAKAIAGAIHADFTDEDVRTATADVMSLYQGGMAAEVVRALWGSQR